MADSNYMLVYDGMWYQCGFKYPGKISFLIDSLNSTKNFFQVRMFQGRCKPMICKPVILLG